GRGGRSPAVARRPRICRPSRLRRENRGVLAANVPAVLHHVVRQLPSGSGACARASSSGPKRMITLTLRELPSVPLEAETISPDSFAGLGLDAIRALPVFHGKRHLRLDDFFDVEGTASDELEIRGELGKVKWIGRGMTRGRIMIAGNVG